MQTFEHLLGLVIFYELIYIYVVRLLRKIGPFILIPIIFVSTIGFSIEIHFCKDEIKGIGLYKVEGCQMNADEITDSEFSKLPPCHQKKALALEKKRDRNGYQKRECCHNESLTFEGSAVSDLTITRAMTLNGCYGPLVREISPVSGKVEIQCDWNWAKYSPPVPRSRDLAVFQVFLI